MGEARKYSKEVWNKVKKIVGVLLDVDMSDEDKKNFLARAVGQPTLDLTDLINAGKLDMLASAVVKHDINKEAIRERIVNHVAQNFTKGSWVAALVVEEYCDYYIATFSCNNSDDKTVAVLSKEGEEIQTGIDTEVIALDGSNYVTVFGVHNKHQRVADGNFSEISCWSSDDTKRSDKRGFTATPELLEKNLMIKHNDSTMQILSRDYLYSFSEGKNLSYGFTSIEATGKIDGKEVDFAKEKGYLPVTLVVSSDLEGDDNKTNVLVGIIGLDGQLIDGMLNITTGDQYSKGESADIGFLEEGIRTWLNEEVVAERKTKAEIEEKYARMLKQIGKPAKAGK